MTVTIQLKPEIEANLVARAKAAGLPLDQYIPSLLETAAAAEGFDWDKAAKTVEGMLEFGDKYRPSLGEPISRKLLRRTPLLNGAFWMPLWQYRGVSPAIPPKTRPIAERTERTCRELRDCSRRLAVRNRKYDIRVAQTAQND
jgi:hypothetical protein